jgi:hypothetical protein
MRLLGVETLPDEKDWIDADTVMIHSCFQILTNYIENEKALEIINYEAHKEFVDEVNELYDWWKVRRLKVHCKDNEHKIDDSYLLRLMKLRTKLWC